MDNSHHDELNFDPLTPGGEPSNPVTAEMERPPTPKEHPPPAPKPYGLLLPPPRPIIKKETDRNGKKSRHRASWRTTKDNNDKDNNDDDMPEIVGGTYLSVPAPPFREPPSKRKRNNLKTVSQLLSNVDVRYFFTFGTRLDGRTEIVKVSNSPGEAEHLVKSRLFTNVSFVVEDSPQPEKDVVIFANDVHLIRKLSEDYRSVPRSSHATFEDFLLSITRKKSGEENKTVQHLFTIADIFAKSNDDEEVPRYFDVD